MWFVLLAIALSVVTVGGLYFRRRLLQALLILGAGTRARRVTGILVPWLLFGYPVILIAFVAISIALQRESFAISATGPFAWFIGYPFWISVLTMLQALPFFLVFDLASRVARHRMASKERHRYWAQACLLVVAVFAVYTPTRIVLARDDLHVHRYQIGEGSGSPLRVVFMGDLQRDAYTDQARADQVVALVNAEKADLILVGGDWINSGADYIDEAASAGGQLRARLGVWSVRGDHEHFAYRDRDRSVREVSQALAKQGVDMIDNQVRRVEHEGKNIGIAFLSYNYIFRSDDDKVRSLLRELSSVDYSILVTHQFDEHLAILVKDQVDLVLSAHTHGGQVNPVLGFWHVPLARVEARFVEGRYRLGEWTTVVVTAGIGFSIAPFRYASPASIEVLEIRPR